MLRSLTTLVTSVIINQEMPKEHWTFLMIPTSTKEGSILTPNYIGVFLWKNLTFESSYIYYKTEFAIH